jgi:hypothetical protein
LLHKFGGVIDDIFLLDPILDGHVLIFWFHVLGIEQFPNSLAKVDLLPELVVLDLVELVVFGLGVVLVEFGGVAGLAQIVVVTGLAFPSDAHNALAFTLVADDVMGEGGFVYGDWQIGLLFLFLGLYLDGG